jgi:hypothetical protein
VMGSNVFIEGCAANEPGKAVSYRPSAISQTKGRLISGARINQQSQARIL